MNDRSCCLVSPRQQLRCCLWKQAVSCASWCAGALGLLSPKEEGGGWGGEALTIQEVDYQLVGAHHDARVGYLAYQVGGETAVQGAEALLFGHCR